MKESFKLRILFAVVTLGLCVTPCFGQLREDSYEMSGYDNALKSEARRREILNHPPTTPAEERAATMGSDSFEYPSILSRFGVGLFEGLAKIRLHGQVGYVNKFGTTEIPAKFDEGGRFSEGLARVRLNGKWGFIDRKGSLFIETRFEWACSFFEGRALVKIGEKWGYINKAGRIVISPRFEHASSFSEGLAAVQLYNGKYKTGYINRRGKWILQPIYDGGSSFHEGLAIVGKDVGYNNGVIVEDYIISKSGRRLFVLNSPYLSSYSEGRLAVENVERDFGYLDLKGGLVIPHRFDHAGSFSEELAPVRLDDKWVYIDKHGRVVLRPDGVCMGGFESGLAGCERTGKYGFIDRTGKFVIGPRFDWVDGFRGQLAAVFVGDKAGYINPKGQYVWEPTN